MFHQNLISGHQGPIIRGGHQGPINRGGHQGPINRGGHQGVKIDLLL
jgi:hypothetical protein